MKRADNRSKTAASLIREWGALENILAEVEKRKKPSVRESLMRNAEKLRKNYQIIKLKKIAELSFALRELEYSGSGLTTNEVLKGIGLK